MRKTTEFLTVFLIGGAAYSIMEILWRGYTHWSMTLTGGVCFCILYALHSAKPPLPLFFRCALGCLTITGIEFLVGCTVNLWLGWQVWDYSGVPLNLLGQICPIYTLIWLALSFVSVPICRGLKRKISAGSF